MANWSISRRRGGKKFAGTAAPPGAPDWGLTPVSTSEIDLYTFIAVPPGINKIYWQRKLTSATTWTDTGTSDVNPIPHTGLAAATSYDFQVAWAFNGTRLSELSDLKSMSTL